MDDTMQFLLDVAGFRGAVLLIVVLWCGAAALALIWIGRRGFVVRQPAGPQALAIRPPEGTADGVMFLLADEAGYGQIVEWRAHAGVWITMPQGLASGIVITPERAAALGLRIVHSCEDLPR